jgi:hypothetical protein
MAREEGLGCNACFYIGIPDATYQQKYCGAAIELLHCKEKIGVITYGVRVIY